MTLLILGCGYTGQRVARRFLARGARVIATTRSPERLVGLGAEIIDLSEAPRCITPGVLVLHSIPPQGPPVLEGLANLPYRLVYLSSTAVYGDAATVDENTLVDPNAERIAEEQRVASGPWSSLILRPAAIYGPGRGYLREVGPPILAVPQASVDNIVSRIHVDDLAAHIEAALLSEITGAYPVADEEPSTPRELAEFCSREPRPARSGRRVDGSAIRRLLGVTLRYPTYREGYAAASSPAVK